MNMKDLRQRLKNYSINEVFLKSWPLWVIVLTVCIFFWKVFFKGLVPLPADFLVGTYYPWLDYKWGFPAGVPVKNPITTDVVSFSYPMRILGIDLMREGMWPLWNRYILAGIPLLANFQSAPFTFTNIFYVFFNNINGWTLQVVSQHFFAMLFMYLLLRNWKFTKLSSLAGGLVFAFAGFNMIWSQWNSHTLTAAFIPLMVLLLDKILKEGKIYWYVLLSFAVCFQIFTGYPQAVLYSIAVYSLYWLINIKNKTFIKKTILLSMFGTIGVSLAMVQILPAYELLQFSQRAIEPLEFDWAFHPWIKSVTLMVPDFFGNHATKNYWGPGDYTMNTGYVGVTAILLALIAVFNSIRKNKVVQYSTLLSILSVLLAFPTPISIYIWESGLFGLQAASAHRAFIILVFSVSLLVGAGVDLILKSSKVNIKYPILFTSSVLVLYSFSSALAYLGDSTNTFLLDYINTVNVTVSLRNLILPWLFLLLSTLLLFSYNRLPQKAMHTLFYFLLLTELFRFGWKYTPFSERSLVYPNTPVISYLQEQNQPFRVTGADVIPINIRMQYRLESLEGYDAIYPVNIAKFIAVANSENIDASPQGRYGTVSNKNSRFLDLTNTKYMINLESEKSDFIVPDDARYQEVFRDKSVAIYENINSLPRVFFTANWEYVSEDKMILSDLLDEEIKFQDKIYVSSNAEQIVESGSQEYIQDVEIVKYNELERAFSVNNKDDGYLFISNSYYPGWIAYANGVEVPIERANYAFKAVRLEPGENEVIIKYEPDSFYLGLKISFVAFIILVSIAGMSFVYNKTLSYTNHSQDEK